MKILVSTFTYYPNMDGVAQSARSMTEYFRDSGHEVIIATSYPNSKCLDELEGFDKNYNVHRFEIKGSSAIFDRYIGDVGKYQEFLIDIDADIIIFHCWDTWSSELAFPIFKKIRAKKIMHSHGYATHLIERKIFPRGIGKWLRWLPHILTLPIRIRKYDKVVFLSHKQNIGRFFDVLVSNFFKAKNISVIPNSVNSIISREKNNFREKHNIQNRILFLHVANYHRVKNQERALRAFVDASIDGSTLVFIGSHYGCYGEWVLKVWNDFKSKGCPSHVIFIECVDRKETIEAINDCDIMLSSSDTEAQPIVLLEGMSSSKPFISTDTGCVSEYRGGIVVSDTLEMSEAMRKLANSKKLREQLGAEGRKHYEEEYDAVRVAGAWNSLINEMSLK